MSFYRGRRLRSNAVIRNLIKETTLHKEDLIYPVFVVEGTGIRNEISSLPGNYHYSCDRLHEVVDEMNAAGVKACLLFGIPDH